MVTNSSFHHNLTCTFNQKNSFTKFVKLDVLKEEMLSKVINMLKNKKNVDVTYLLFARFLHKKMGKH